MQQLNSIHALRGFAALAVAMFHGLSWAQGYGVGTPESTAFEIGKAGVDVFFIISGLVLTIAAQRPQSRWRFLIARLARVGLPYWVVTLAIAAAALAAHSAFRSFAVKPSDLALSLAFIPSIPSGEYMFPLLQPGWTLSLEMVFYVMLALVLPMRADAREGAVIAMLLGLVLMGFVWRPEPGVLRFFSQAVLAEFAVGILIARAILVGVRLSLPGAAACLALSAIGFALAAYAPPSDAFAARALAYGTPAAALVAGLSLYEARRRIELPRLLRAFGDISFSFYLIHTLAFATLAKFAGHRIAAEVGNAGLFLIMMTAALVSAIVFHRIVEVPALALARRIQRGDNRGSSAEVNLSPSVSCPVASN
jgi:exopolysaccharide production protein ExoZ